MLDDILEESWTYQEIIKKGMLRERQQRLQEQHEMVMNLIHMRFPELVFFAQSHIETIHDTDALHTLLNKLFTVQTEAEAKQAITNASTAEIEE